MTSSFFLYRVPDPASLIKLICGRKVALAIGRDVSTA
jgi:hypothetical protein